ncbi:MAG: DUF6427 family protein [Bacteroidia bacterium]
MIKILKSNPGIAFIIVPLIAILAWVLAYSKGLMVATNGAMPLYDLLIKFVLPEQKLFYSISGCLLVIAQAFHLNFVLNKHEVIYKNSWLPSLFYVLLMSLIPQFLVFQPILIANSITILIIDKIFKLYKNQQPLALDFDIGFLISTSALFYYPSIILVLLFFAGVIILKPFAWRDWIVGLMGLILPFFFVFTYYFLTDQFQYLTTRFFTANIRQDIDVWRLLPKGFGITVGYILVLLVLALLKLSQHFNKNVIRTRNLQQLMLIFNIVCAIMIVLTPEVQLYRFTVLAIPFSFLLAYYFLAAKKSWYAEVAFWLLIANIVYNFFLMKLVM